MPRIANRFNWGSPEQKTIEDLYRQMVQIYADIVNVLNTKTSVLSVEASNPPSNSQLNSNYDIGDFYIRKDVNKVWMMTNRTTLTAVTWTPIN